MEIITEINEYISPEYTQKSKDIFSRLPLDKYKLLLNMYLNQNNNTVDEYILFGLSDDNNVNDVNDVNIINNYSTYSDKDSYNVIYYDLNEKIYLFQAYSFQNMYELIILNKNKYVFIPVMFSLKDSKVGHATMIIIDKIEMTIKFFDSNGMTKEYINSTIVDSFLEYYFNIFNITFNENYEYIKQKEWIKSNYTLNSSTLSNNDINAGHCMIFTLLIAHILSKQTKTLDQIITELNKLTKNELFDFVMGYTERAIENLNLIL
jgi:hypothetical protein